MSKKPRRSLSPSSASRWVSCQASPLYIAENQHRIIEKPTAFYNTEGSLFHEEAAKRIDGDTHEKIEKPEVLTDWQWEEMEKYADDWQDFIETKAKPGSIILAEQKLKLPYVPDGNCYVDAAVVNDGSLYVADAKYGKGLFVDNRENLQIAIYGYTIAETLDAIYDLGPNSLITLVIWQPRARCWGGVRPWTLQRCELEEFLKPVLDIAATILAADTSDELPFAPSKDNCRWCPASGRRSLEEIVKILKDQPDMDLLFEEDPDLLTDLVFHRKKIEKYLNGVADYLATKLKSGIKVKGAKLVAGNLSNRKWVDIEEAEKVLLKTVGKKDATKTTLISPTAALEVLKERNCRKPTVDKIEALITRTSGPDQMVPESDPREDTGKAGKEMFNSEDEDDFLN